MSVVKQVKTGRICEVIVESGEDLLREIEHVIERENITKAVFTVGFGSLISCHTHYADDNLRQEVPVVITDVPMTLCALSGFVEEKESGNVVHLHGVLSDGETTRTAHIHDGCIVLHSFYLVITEILDS